MPLQTSSVRHRNRGKSWAHTACAAAGGAASFTAPPFVTTIFRLAESTETTAKFPLLPAFVHPCTARNIVLSMPLKS
jgi:hypothetical protein